MASAPSSAKTGTDGSSSRLRTNIGSPADNDIKSSLDQVETALGYSFANPQLLLTALTHPSSVAEPAPRRNKSDMTAGHGSGAHNQRLEFLGDRVIGLVIADYLYHRDETSREGSLTRQFARFVENSQLAAIARKLGLGACLQVQPNTALANTEKVLADALEAVIGAIWCDGGMAAARPVVLKLLADDKAMTEGDLRDAKTRLQELSLGRGWGLPVYSITDRQGPDHAPQFSVTVKIDEITASATGKSRRNAEQAAANAALQQLGEAL